MGLLPLEYLKLLLENVCCSLLGDRASNIKNTRHRHRLRLKSKCRRVSSDREGEGERATRLPGLRCEESGPGPWSSPTAEPLLPPSPSPGSTYT